MGRRLEKLPSPNPVPPSRYKHEAPPCRLQLGRLCPLAPPTALWLPCSCQEPDISTEALLVPGEGCAAWADLVLSLPVCRTFLSLSRNSVHCPISRPRLLLLPPHGHPGPASSEEVTFPLSFKTTSRKPFCHTQLCPFTTQSESLVKDVSVRTCLGLVSR